MAIAPKKTNRTGQKQPVPPTCWRRRRAAGLLIGLLAGCFLGTTKPAKAIPYVEYTGRDPSGFFRMVLDLHEVGGKVALMGGRIEFRDLGNPYPIQQAAGRLVPKNLTAKQFAGALVFAQANLGASATLFIGTLTGDLGRGPIHVMDVRFAYRNRTEQLAFDLLPVGAPAPGGGGAGGTGGGGGGTRPVSPPVSPPPGVYLFNNTNTGFVISGPRSPTVVTFLHPVTVTSIATYHWNNGRGATPGQISLIRKSLVRGLNRSYGPWKARGVSGQNNMADVNWEVQPNITIPAGTYEVIDSDPRTWSCNMNSRFIGFTRISGH